ncbi:MAG TPA: bifunctional adenosylcobinamide kinase/adenosylcobinamide-phosphate guanylyltransferase [Candidatus Choladocola avistercoris]|nr:bifunctional adenosylcobinamide kinase/adenosylcobinamide-phosphate guanylyltransferase [Candidatus Choladocola avistercoris]
MILVTGGCFQGKKEYAFRQFGIRPEDAADGASCPLEAIYEAGMLYHFHEYIRRLMQEGREFSLEELLERNPQIVLVTNELGYGVVPVDQFDRAYREKTGRVCCKVAQAAQEVHRVVCGLGTVIKHG